MAQNADTLTTINQNSAPSLGNQIYDLISKLFVNWPVMVSTILAVVFILIITHFLFRKPISAAIQNRVSYIENQIKISEQNRKQSELKKDKAQQIINAAIIQAETIIASANQEVEFLKKDKLASLEKELASKKKQADQEINAKIKKFEAKAKKMIIDQSIMIAKKILEREFNYQDHARLVEGVLENVKKDL